MVGGVCGKEGWGTIMVYAKKPTNRGIKVTKEIEVTLLYKGGAVEDYGVCKEANT